MKSQPSMGAGFRTRTVANGAALQIELSGSSLNYDVSEGLRGRLKDVVGDHLEEGHRTFILEMEGITLIDSCGIGMLISVHHQVVAAGGVLAITGSGQAVSKMLRLMQLDRFLQLYPDQQKALRAVAEVV